MNKIALLLSALSCLHGFESDPVEVLRVIDGDTIEVAADLGGQVLPVSVRLLYLDTPETRGANAMPEGAEARAALEALLPAGESVVLWGPAEEMERDRYGRILAVALGRTGLRGGATEAEAAELQRKIEAGHLPTHGSNVNAIMIAQGWSVYWRKFGRHPDDRTHQLLLDWQELAKGAHLGAWTTAPKWMQDKANERTAPRRP